MRTQLFFGAAIAALMIPAAASAQETTSIIRGTVTKGDAPVVGATVVATDVNSGTRSSTTTGSDGAFSLPGLRAGGPYTVDVTSPEGNTSVTDIFTVVQQAYDLPISLAEAESAGDIVVTASSIRGAGNNSGGPQTILTRADISKVASVNRDVRDLQRRDPFATLDLTNGRAVSFAGVNPRFNRFTINGVQVGDNFGLNSDASPTGRGPVPLDAIGQFSVSIAPYDIRQGNFTGGAIDTVLASGTNEFHGTGFYSVSRDELQGSRIGTLQIPIPNYNSQTYGATIRGPIIPDTLFFMISGERNTDPRPLPISQINQVPNLTQATIDAVSAIAQSRYGFDAGGVIGITNNLDEKIVGRIDWNVTPGQKLSLSYINAFDSRDVQNNSSTSAANPSLGLGSNYHRATQLLRAGIVQLNSDWTSKLSTEARILYRSSRNGRVPLGGATGFAQFRVCTEATSTVLGTNLAITCAPGTPVVALGTEQFTQTNELFFDEYGASLLARYSAGRHEIKALFEYDQRRINNFFIPSSLGVYYFDSLADFSDGNASQLLYGAATRSPATTAAADFRYGQYTLGLQDDWQVTDDLKLNLGIRYDVYAQNPDLTLNPNYVNRFGFANNNNYKGLDNFQPRIGFNYKPLNKLQIRGGFGIFGGGSPDIYLANSYGNTGVLTNAITVARASPVASAPPVGAQATATCTAPFTGANAAVCTDALNNVTGTSIPASVNGNTVNNLASLVNAPTASLAQNFRLPSVYKWTLSADYNLFGFNLGVDFLHTEANQAISFTDIRSVVTGTLPDGRPRYAPLTSLGAPNSDANADIVLTNTSRGYSNIIVARFSKVDDFGLSYGGSYTYQDVRDVSPATASQATSLYGQAAAIDPNNPAFGHSNDETRWQFKYNIGFDHAFFGDYRTVFQLFGETRAGRNFSFTGQSTGARSAVFGTTNSNVNAQTRYLLYVPTGLDDSRVSYDTTATRDSLDTLINSTALNRYRGRVADKNIARSRAFTRIDLHLEQEIPTFVGKSRITLFADIENLPNLLNSNWGGLRQFGFPYTAAVVQVACLATATPTGTAPAAGVTNTASNQVCSQYRYSQFTAPNTSVPSSLNSLYLIRVGARFTF